VFGIATLLLALYRKILSLKEDDLVHVAPGEERLIPNQIEMAHKMDVIDRWGKTLTVITVALGLVLAGGYLYQAWAEHLR
jgi:hypothetical protein